MYTTYLDDQPMDMTIGQYRELTEDFQQQLTQSSELLTSAYANYQKDLNALTEERDQLRSKLTQQETTYMDNNHEHDWLFLMACPYTDRIFSAETHEVIIDMVKLIREADSKIDATKQLRGYVATRYQKVLNLKDALYIVIAWHHSGMRWTTNQIDEYYASKR